jgi:hypothetical protein
VTPRAALGVAIVLATVAAPAVVFGDDDFPDPSGWDGQGYLGVEGSILPYGNFHLQAAGLGVDSAADTAYGLSVNYGEHISQYLSIEFAPRILFHVESSDAEYDNHELDLRLRVRAGGPLNIKNLRLFAEVTGGYSFVLTPADEKQDDPRGFIVGVGAGVSYGIRRKTALTFVVDYQYGFQGISSNIGDVTESDSLLELTLGFITQVRWADGATE